MKPHGAWVWAVALATGVLMTSGCSFSREWGAASRRPPATNDITGAWIGRWQNSNNDHTDRLKAVITKVSDTEYHARFKAWWLGVLSGTFETTLTGEWRDGAFVFRGDQRVMGWTFSQEGHVGPNNFRSRYSSDDFQGEFWMYRPAPAP